MTKTKKQKAAHGIGRPAVIQPGALPWRGKDIVRHMPDGSTELLRWSVVDANGNEVIADMPEAALRDRVVEAVNLHRSAGGRHLSASESYLDPMSILHDARDILPHAARMIEEVQGEKDEVLRDLVKRVKRVTKAR